MQYIILAQSEMSQKGVGAWCRLLCSPDEEQILKSAIVFDLDSCQVNGADEVYEYLANRIEQRIEESRSPSHQFTVIVDAIDAVDLSLVRDGCSWSNIVALLIATFPEFHWAFCFEGRYRLAKGDTQSVQERCASEKFPDEEHGRYSILRQSRHQLFDPTALRGWIRARTNEDLKRMAKKAGNLNTPFQLPLRVEMAAVIEDEVDFAMLHGYAAYKHGFRTDVVTSWKQMKALFHCEKSSGQESRQESNEEGTGQRDAPARTDIGNAVSSKVPRKLPDADKHPYRLILEDMRLQFADKSANISLSKPADREENCNRLADVNDMSDFRFCISTGQDEEAGDLWEEYEGYLYNKSYGVGRLLAKPVGGPLELWRETGLKDLLEDGKATGFVSPPAEITDDLYGGHGAPGKLALVAGKLIERSRRMLAEAETPTQFIVAAVLANDALELLGGKTPTMSMEALKLRTTAEVKAECAFLGAGFHFDLKDRFAEIDEFVKSICRWYKAERDWCEWDAKAAIYNELVKIYRDAGQMEEEDKCLVQLRAYNRKLERPRGWNFWNPLAWALHGILTYAEWLLADFGRILLMFSFWICLFALLGSLNTGQANPLIYFAKQLNWMVGGGTQDITLSDGMKEHDSFLVPLSIASNILGVFHFGILMSYLYGLISRK